MKIYSVVFVDQTHESVNADSAEEAIRTAQEKFSKAVASIAAVAPNHDVEQESLNTFESLRRGGPNL